MWRCPHRIRLISAREFCHSLCDRLRIVGTQGIINGDKVIGAVVLHMEERKLDGDHVCIRGSDLPLTARLWGVAAGVSRR